MKSAMESLLSGKSKLLAGKRIGLVSHRAAVNAAGIMSANLLKNSPDMDLAALFGPEHGFDIRAGAGEPCRSGRHREWKIPIHSLYGASRKPTRQMLEDVDTLVVDLQDLGYRCYTYVSTLRLVLEAAADYGKPVIVCDRPVPLPCTVDGPVTVPRYESFVSMITAPMCYGMTPAETASWLVEELGLELDLTLIPMPRCSRDQMMGPARPLPVPPSPAIRSWHIAQCYPATVFGEAMPSINYGRGTDTPFETISAAWIKPPELSALLAEHRLRGVRFVPCEVKGEPGIRLRVHNPSVYRPILVSLAIISSLQQLYGKRRLWRGARHDFFDKLYGTDSVRASLLDHVPPRSIAGTWKSATDCFKRCRERHLLYSCTQK